MVPQGGTEVGREMENVGRVVEMEGVTVVARVVEMEVEDSACLVWIERS
jgi:hypothetical protein